MAWAKKTISIEVEDNEIVEKQTVFLLGVGKSTNELLIECFKQEYSAFKFIIAVSSSGTDLQASDPNSWIFTDPASFPLQRKLWNSYFLVVETLDEKQVHIVKQVRRVILKPAETPCSNNSL